ncbi:MAG: hypothetical protein ACI9VR_003707 [Cognaticolwellia sp.]|jgi:hypothetical protein
MLFLLLACADPVEPASYLSVLTMNPSNGAINVPMDADLRVIFSADLQDPSAQQVNLSTAEGTPVPTALRWFDDSASMLVIDPIENLAANTDFVLTLGSGVDSQVGTLGAQVESSFSTGSTTEGDSDTDADGDTDSDSDADSDSDTDADTDSDADADATFTPYGVGLTVLAAWDGENLIRWQDADGSFQTPYAQFTFFEEAYFDTGDERYSCDWYGSVQVQEAVAIDQEAYGAMRVRFSDLGASSCEGFPQVWSKARTPAEVLSSQDYGLAFTPMSDDFRGDFRQAVDDSGGNWENDWEPYVFTTQLAQLDAEYSDWQELSYTFASDLNDDGVLPSDPSAVELDQGIEGELVYAQPWSFSAAENWVD